MVNKQKIWFLSLFSLILILSVYYITMPNELLQTVSKEEANEEIITNTSELSNLDTLQVELDEQRALKRAEYNEVLTNDKSTSEDKNKAYDDIKKIDEIKAKEEMIRKIINDELSLKSFVKIEEKSVYIVINNKEHDYSLANKIIRRVTKEFKEDYYISVKFDN